MIDQIRSRIREVPDFPSPGILFYDITTALVDAQTFKACLDSMATRFSGEHIDLVVAMESRGFIFGAPLAYILGAGFVPIRKLGKLPAETVTREYALEYGANTLEMHRDAIVPGHRVLLVDDLLATGGTVAASLEMVRELGGEPVAVAVLVELMSLNGRQRLESEAVEVVSFIQY